MPTYKYRCIGKGVTDSQGIAHITHDCEGNPLSTTGYKGVGAGMVDFVASTVPPSEIVDNSFQSDGFEVLDCIRYDKGDSPNQLWTLGNSGNSKLDLVDNSYRKLSEITTGTDAWVYLKIDHSCILEFDVRVVSTDYSKPFGQYGQSPNANTRRQINLPSTIQDNEWHTIKLTLQNGVAVMTSTELPNPVTYTLQQYDSSVDIYWRFRTDTDITEVHFKEFKYYSIS